MRVIMNYFVNNNIKNNQNHGDGFSPFWSLVWTLTDGTLTWMSSGTSVFIKVTSECLYKTT